MLLLLGLLLGCGLACLIVGLRGRIVDSQLHCRRCSYILTGIERDPDSRCPECGHSVWTGVRMRHRRERRMRPLRLGVIMLVLAAACAALHIIDLRVGLDWYQARSTQALMGIVMGDAAGASERTRAWTELNRRRKEGALSNEDLDEISAFALDLHIQQVRAHEAPASGAELAALHLVDINPQHAAWIGAAVREKLVPREVIAAYAEALYQPVVDATTRMTVGENDTWPVWLHLYGRPPAREHHAAVAVMIERVTIDGEAFDLSTDAMCSGMLHRSTASNRPSVTRLDIPHVPLPGKHSVVLEFRCGLVNLELGEGDSAVSLGGQLTSWALWPPTLFEWTFTRTYELNVRPAPPSQKKARTP